MDEQNFQNEQNSVEEQRVQATNNYQDYTTNVQTQHTVYTQPAQKQTNALAKQLTKLTKHTVHIAIKLIVINSNNHCFRTEHKKSAD